MSKKNKKRIISKEILVDLYVKRGFTIKEISKKLSASNNTISRNLKDNDIHVKTNVEIHTKHGMFNNRLYKIWLGMRTRCDNKKQHIYQKYGAIGISYPEEWKVFENFWEDMKDGYSDNKTLDRKDNALGYSKENCRWIDYKGQNRNKGDNVLVAYKGKTKTIAEWAEELDIPQATLYSRKKAGWNDEKIIGEKSLGRNQYSKD